MFEYVLFWPNIIQVFRTQCVCNQPYSANTLYQTGICLQRPPVSPAETRARCMFRPGATPFRPQNHITARREQLPFPSSSSATTPIIDTEHLYGIQQHTPSRKPTTRDDDDDDDDDEARAPPPDTRQGSDRHWHRHQRRLVDDVVPVMAELVVGQKIQLSDGRHGTIRFVGQTAFAAGDWVGIELDDDSGKNDGSVQGERYFDCPMGSGMFVRPATVTVLAQPPPRAAITAKRVSRPSSLLNTGSSRPAPADAGLAKRMSLNAPSPSPGPKSRPSSLVRVSVSACLPTLLGRYFILMWSELTN